MHGEKREAVEKRAYSLGEPGGRKEDSALLHWRRAEQDFGLVPIPEADDPASEVRSAFRKSVQSARRKNQLENVPAAA